MCHAAKLTACVCQQHQQIMQGSPQCLLLPVLDASHEVGHEGVVHAAIGSHVTLHQPLKLVRAAPLPANA